MRIEALKQAAEEALHKARGAADKAREALPDLPKELPELPKDLTARLEAIPGAKDLTAKLGEGRERAEELIGRLEAKKPDVEMPAAPEDVAAKVEETAGASGLEPPKVEVEHPVAG